MKTNPGPESQRAVAESFGVDAERYDRTRTRYPAGIVDQIAGRGRDVLSIGTGTGIEARQLSAAGCRVLGVEPDERMAAFAREHGTDVEVATFEDWDARGRDFDAVVAATAWHWIDPAAAAAKALQILRPAGRLSVFWNAAQPPQPISHALAEAIRHAYPDAPVPPPTLSVSQAYTAMRDTAAGGIAAAGGFAGVHTQRIDWRQSYTREQWLDQLSTTGLLTRAPTAVREVVEARVGAAIDAVGGEFTVDYATIVVTAERR